MAISYAERIRRAALKNPGKTRQELRGHKAHEHVTRATNKGLPPPRPKSGGRRGGAAGGGSTPPPPPRLTKNQKASISKFGREQALRRYGADATPEQIARVRKKMLLRAQVNGWHWFTQIRATQRDLTRIRRQGGLPPLGGPPNGAAALASLMNSLDVDPEDDFWLWYGSIAG